MHQGVILGDVIGYGGNANQYNQINQCLLIQTIQLSSSIPNNTGLVIKVFLFKLGWMMMKTCLGLNKFLLRVAGKWIHHSMIY